MFCFKTGIFHKNIGSNYLKIKIFQLESLWAESYNNFVHIHCFVKLLNSELKVFNQYETTYNMSKTNKNYLQQTNTSKPFAITYEDKVMISNLIYVKHL